MSAQLRVATYNIHHGADGRDRLDLARIAETLAGLRADVIGLQEVDVAFGARSAFEDQAAGLAEMLGLRGCSAPRSTTRRTTGRLVVSNADGSTGSRC